MSARQTSEIRVSIWRGDQTGGEISHYRVPRQPSQTVLDVVTWIQRNVEPGLSYRFACRVGMCGSCAMMVNGRPRWTCRTNVKDLAGGQQLELAPLRNLPVIKDLVCDMSEFFAKWQRAEGRFTPRHAATPRHHDGHHDEHHDEHHDGRHQAVANFAPDSPRRRAVDAAIECINCAVCYAACDVVAWNPDYLGPAALNRAWTLVNDVRDGAQAQRLQAISAAGGCQNCHSQQGCTSHCPVQLNPARSIAGLKQTVAKSAAKATMQSLKSTLKSTLKSPL